MSAQELLNKALKKVNDAYFHISELPDIILSRGQDKVNRRSIVFGTYHTKKNIIKIHPVLLQESVPSYALEFVIYHEMLHFQDRDELLARKKGDLVHSPEFKKREKLFQQYDEAQQILKNILHGKEMSVNKTKQTAKLSGEALEQALAESLKRLDEIMVKYNLVEEKVKGARNGAKKKNEQV